MDFSDSLMIAFISVLAAGSEVGRRLDPPLFKRVHKDLESLGAWHGNDLSSPPSPQSNQGI